MNVSKVKKRNPRKRSVPTSKNSNMTLINNGNKRRSLHSKTLPVAHENSVGKSLAEQSNPYKSRRSLRNKTLPTTYDTTQEETEVVDIDEIKENKDSSHNKSRTSCRFDGRVVNGQTPLHNVLRTINHTDTARFNNNDATSSSGILSEDCIDPQLHCSKEPSSHHSEEPSTSSTSNTAPDLISLNLVNKYNSLLDTLAARIIWWKISRENTQEYFTEPPMDDCLKNEIKEKTQGFQEELDIRLKKLQDLDKRFKQSTEIIRNNTKYFEKHKRQCKTSQISENVGELIKISDLTVNDDIPIPKDGKTCFKNFLSTYRFQKVKEKYKKKDDNA